MTLFNSINNQGIWKYVHEARQYTFKDYDEFMVKYWPETNPEAFYNLNQIWWFFDEMGTLLYRGYLSIDDCGHLTSVVPVELFLKYQHIISELRVKYWKSNVSHLMHEYLVKMLISEAQSKDGTMRLSRLLKSIPDVELPDVYSNITPEET